jgi:hypothetical protein
MSDAKVCDKFTVGQQVVCRLPDVCYLEQHLSYTIRSVRKDFPNDLPEYYLEEVPYSWMEERFEDFLEWSEKKGAPKEQHYDTWASHQKLVSDADELFFTKHQVEMLQEFKKDALEREKKLVEALNTIIADYSRNGYGHFQAKFVAEVALRELGYV